MGILDKWEFGFDVSKFTTGSADETKANMSSFDSSAKDRFPKAEACSERDGYARKSNSQINDSERSKNNRFSSESERIFELAIA